MAQSTFSIRMDSQLKQNFEQLCAEFGMSLSTAFNIFAKTVVRERKIPFEISANNTTLASMNAFHQMRQIAEEKGLSDMTLEEINAEIDAVRKNKK